MGVGEGQFLEGLKRNSQDILLRSLRYTGSRSRPESAWKTWGGKCNVQRLGLPTKRKSGCPTLSFFSPAEARNLPPLTEAQKNKLRHLSVVTLAAKVKVSGSPPVVSHRASFCMSRHKGHLKGICTGTAFDTLLLLPAFPSTFFPDLQPF